MILIHFINFITAAVVFRSRTSITDKRCAVILGVFLKIYL